MNADEESAARSGADGHRAVRVLVPHGSEGLKRSR